MSELHAAENAQDAAEEEFVGEAEKLVATHAQLQQCELEAAQAYQAAVEAQQVRVRMPRCVEGRQRREKGSWDRVCSKVCHAGRKCCGRDYGEGCGCGCACGCGYVLMRVLRGCGWAWVQVWA